MKRGLGWGEGWGWVVLIAEQAKQAKLKTEDLNQSKHQDGSASEVQ